MFSGPNTSSTLPMEKQSLESIFEEVRSVAARIVLLDDPESLTADSLLADDLGADSLDAIKIVVELQRRTGLHLSDEELMNMTSLGEIANALYSKQE
jgi:acyl carrier protein